MEIRALRRTDVRTGFSCGEPDIDSFLLKYAGQNQFRHRIGVTYVAVEQERVTGFATVAATSVQLDLLPEEITRALPSYPPPALRLARMAVDLRLQRQGIGSELTLFVMALAVRMSHDVGCVGVLVDAKPDAVAFYERMGFFRLGLLEGRSTFRPVPATLFLPIDRVKEAARAAGLLE
jgi:predicted N-acetyltransferase YhbS